MPLDALYLGALTREIGKAVLGGKIDKLYQPEKDQLIFNLRCVGGNCKLLLCASPNHARLQLATGVYENPAAPPMFCMLLRKHLLGARIVGVRQLPYERVVMFDFVGLNELFEEETKQLVLELIGRQSNLILCSGDGKIISAMKYSELSEKQERLILPGALYVCPPPQEKLAPIAEHLPRILAELAQCGGEQLDRFLLKRVLGLSPLLARELSFRATGQTDYPIGNLTAEQRSALEEQLADLFEALRRERLTPYIIEDEAGAAVDFSFCPITQYGEKLRLRQLDSFSETIDRFYYLRDKAERVHHHTNDILKQMHAAKERLTRKLACQQEELLKSKNREPLRLFGELLTAHMGKMERGMRQVTVSNYYDENQGEITIPLDVKLSPAKNAQRYFRLYQKAKNAQGILEEQLLKGQEELDYVESVLESLSKVETEKEMSEIRGELAAGKPTAKKKGFQRTKPSLPLHFVSSDGFDIYVGKNNTQNDTLTQGADKNDWWLHVQIGPGSHVVVSAEGRELPDQTVTEAAMLAAAYSSAAGSANVPVCYTRICFVKKPAGAKPGKVIYKNYQTAFVTPDAARLQRLKRE